ncbi:MAG: hypothetical protein JWP91_859 [Fibrobacteres bacterium]|nr:hypothetical protein [Fibrobacterota bacterium]
MHNWRKEKFEGLRQVIEYLSDKAQFHKYMEYCDFRGQGLRKEAFKALNGFLGQATLWDFNERKEFVDWILWVHNGLPDVTDLLPDPMYQKLIEPTLLEWQVKEPGTSAAFRWSGGVDNLRKALKIDENDDIAKIKFAKAILNHSNYSIHELPSGYLGDPHEDLSDVAEAIQYLVKPFPDPSRDSILSNLTSNYETIEKWILEIENRES